MKLTYIIFILAVIYAKKTMGSGMTNVMIATSLNEGLFHHTSTAGQSIKCESGQSIKYKPRKHLKDEEAIFIMCLVVFIFSFLFISPLIQGLLK